MNNRYNNATAMTEFAGNKRYNRKSAKYRRTKNLSGLANINQNMTLSGAGPIKPPNDVFSLNYSTNYNFDQRHASLSGFPSNSAFSGSTAVPRRNSITRQKSKKIKNMYIAESNFSSAQNQKPIPRSKPPPVNYILQNK